MSPKHDEDPRVVFPSDLGKELLRVASERGHPESKLSPLLRALAREWIENGSYLCREEELGEITNRISSVEDQLRILVDRIGETQPPPGTEQSKKTSVSKLDNLTHRILEHLTEIADQDGVTVRVTAQDIAAKIARQGDQPTEKKVRERIKKLIAKGLISIEEDSGGRGGRRYRIE